MKKAVKMLLAVVVITAFVGTILRDLPTVLFSLALLAVGTFVIWTLHMALRPFEPLESQEQQAPSSLADLEASLAEVQSDLEIARRDCSEICFMEAGSPFMWLHDLEVEEQHLKQLIAARGVAA